MPMRLAGFLLLLLALGLAGCAGGPDFGRLGVRRPPARVASVQVLEQTEQAVRLAIVVQVTNPNDVALGLVGAEYRVELAGREAVSFRDQPNRTLPRNGSQQVLLTAAVPTDGQVVAGSTYSIRGTLTYQPPGEIRQMLTDTYVPLPTTPFRAQGTLESKIRD